MGQLDAGDFSSGLCKKTTGNHEVHLRLWGFYLLESLSLLLFFKLQNSQILFLQGFWLLGHIIYLYHDNVISVYLSLREWWWNLLKTICESKLMVLYPLSALPYNLPKVVICTIYSSWNIDRVVFGCDKCRLLRGLTHNCSTTQWICGEKVVCAMGASGVLCQSNSLCWGVWGGIWDNGGKCICT